MIDVQERNLFVLLVQHHEHSVKEFHVLVVVVDPDEIAYIKPVVENGEHAFGIFAADGEQIGEAPDYKLACAISVQNDLYPVSVH